MKEKEAYTISIGVLAAIDTYLTATGISVPVWVTFIAWASYFIAGASWRGLACNLCGWAIGSCTLVVMELWSGPAAAAILVGLGSAAMVQAPKLTTLEALPAIVCGFASTVGTVALIGRSAAALTFENPVLIAVAGLLIGNAFGCFPNSVRKRACEYLTSG
jgi:Protein of unknown function (DUF1097)